MNVRNPGSKVPRRSAKSVLKTPREHVAIEFNVAFHEQGRTAQDRLNETTDRPFILPYHQVHVVVHDNKARQVDVGFFHRVSDVSHD